MSLAQYCREKRTVVQRPSTTVYDAARTLENNHIGAIIVQDSGRVVGIATDRDLALRTIGFELDPKEATLHDVMSAEPVTLEIDDTEEQASALMRARHVRRMPIVDGERGAGIVTLDDLIMAGSLDSEAAAQIIEAQLAEPAHAKPPGIPHPTRPSQGGTPAPSSASRHAARAENTLRQFAARLQERLGLSDGDRALAAFEVVTSSIVRRLTPPEAQDFAAQLPSSLREKLLDLPAGPDFAVTRASIDTEVARRLNLDLESASVLVRRVGESLADFVSDGELDDVVNQLPHELKKLIKRPGKC